jgi:hypothetical protein
MDKKELLELGLKFRGGAFPGETWESLNAKYKRPFPSGEAFRSFVRRELKKENKTEDKTETNTYSSKIELNKDGSQISDKLIKMSENDAKDAEFLLKAHGYDNKFWELVSARNNIWNSYSKKDGIMTLYSSKIMVKPRKDDISLEEVKEHFIKFSKTYKSPKVQKYEYLHTGKMFEVPIMDLHFGKLGWINEVGENYDFKIAGERFLHVINDFINRTKQYNFDKIIFPIGQDFFNFDFIDGTTTKGTRQDNDLRWQKLFLKGIELLIESIDLLSKIAPVEVFYIPGNHDKTTSYYATNYIYAWYRNNENINVSIEPHVRKYVEYGNCLIGYSHGELEKKRISGIMQVEAREAWGRTKFHEWHLGHLHSEHTKEENGIIIRKISSITGSDAWHTESGYVGAIKKAQSFVWDKKYGLETILNSVILN